MARFVSPEGERLRRAHKLRRRADFLRCYRHGRKRRGTLATLHLHPNNSSAPRLGITASRKVGNAVVRHRLKRQVREIFRRYPSRQHLPAFDLVVHLWPSASQADFEALREEIEKHLASVFEQTPAPRRQRAKHQGVR